MRCSPAHVCWHPRVSGLGRVDRPHPRLVPGRGPACAAAVLLALLGRRPAAASAPLLGSDAPLRDPNGVAAVAAVRPTALRPAVAGEAPAGAHQGNLVVADVQPAPAPPGAAWPAAPVCPAGPGVASPRRSPGARRARAVGAAALAAQAHHLVTCIFASVCLACGRTAQGLTDEVALIEPTCSGWVSVLSGEALAALSSSSAQAALRGIGPPEPGVVFRAASRPF